MEILSKKAKNLHVFLEIFFKKPSGQIVKVWDDSIQPLFQTNIEKGLTTSITTHVNDYYFCSQCNIIYSPNLQ
ncbi:hypothetical protein DRN93_01020 [archaeon]|nr:MAG: hypothetical protein DRN93_01020 [archaeon]